MLGLTLKLPSVQVTTLSSRWSYSTCLESNRSWYYDSGQAVLHIFLDSSSECSVLLYRAGRRLGARISTIGCRYMRCWWAVVVMCLCHGGLRSASSWLLYISCSPHRSILLIYTHATVNRQHASWSPHQKTRAQTLDSPSQKLKSNTQLQKRIEPYWR